MSTNLPLWRIAVAGLVLLLVLSGGLAAQETGASHQKPSHLWCEVLDAALDRTAEDKALLEQIAERRPAQPEGNLAEVLLEEWGLPPDAEELREPRVIVAPKPDYSDLSGKIRLKSWVIAATGHVTPLGGVEDVELRIGSGVHEIDQRCLDAFSRWRYRPARTESGYVASTVAVTCHVHPR